MHLSTDYYAMKDHNELFDRLILATAIAENCILISTDVQVGMYEARMIW